MLSYRIHPSSLIGTLIALLAGTACSSSGPLKKTLLDQSASLPSWVGDSRTSWEADQKIRVRGMQQIRGDERLSGCYELARLNAKSLLIGEIQEKIKGALDTHETSLSENAEILLSKSRTAEFGGELNGLRMVEEYFARYRIGDDERMDCHVLAEVTREDYLQAKRRIIHKLQEADPRLKEQIVKKHIDFFN
jgi:hypothetical protein